MQSVQNIPQKLFIPVEAKVLNVASVISNNSGKNAPIFDSSKMKVNFLSKFENFIDRGRESFEPWQNSSSLNCTNFRNHFAKPGSFLPTIWLASYPGSGNTWLRYLIEGATGFFTRGPDPIVRLFQIFLRFWNICNIL